MFIYAICPHCHDAELQYPESKRGTAVKCHRCGKAFPLFEVENQKATKAPVSQVRPDSPVAVEVEPEVAVPSEATGSLDVALGIALFAVGVFGPAMIATQFSYGRFVAVPLLLLGLAAGGISLLGLEKRAWLGWVAAGVNAVGLLLVVALPSWIGASTWLPQVVESSAPKTPVSVDRSGKAQTAEWVDAAQGIWQMEDVRVSVTSVVLDVPKGKGKDLTLAPSLRVGLRVINAGVARTVEFTGWPTSAPTDPNSADATPVPTLTAAGKALLHKPVEGAIPPTQPIRPGKSADVVLTFDAPSAPGDLKLELSPKPLGVKDPVRFVVPWGMVAGREKLSSKLPSTKP